MLFYLLWIWYNYKLIHNTRSFYFFLMFGASRPQIYRFIKQGDWKYYSHIPGPSIGQAQHNILQRQSDPVLRRPGHAGQILGAGVHHRRSHHTGCQRGGPEHDRSICPGDRPGVSSRSPEQSQHGQHTTRVNHLDRAVLDRRPCHRTHLPQ